MDVESQSLIDFIAPAADASSGRGVPFFWLLAGLVLLVVGHAIVRAAPAVWRLGFDARRVLGHRGRAVRSVGVGLLLGLAGLWLLRSLPTAIGVVALLAVVFLFAATGTLQDAIGGAYAQFRLRLREGDRLSVGSQTGEVRALHWEYVVLRTQDGDAVHVPNRFLLREPVTLQAMRNAEPLATRVSVPTPTEVDLDRLRDAVSVSAYRASGTPVEVSRGPDGVEVRWYLWSREARQAAERQVASLIADQRTPLDNG